MKGIKVCNRKKQRKIELLWNKLVKFENFEIPETAEEWKEFGFLSPSITINNHICYFKKDIIPLLNELVREIYNIDEIKKCISYNTVSLKIRAQIQEVLVLKLQKSSMSFNDILSNLLAQILNECKNYVFFWHVKGVKITDKSSINFGKAVLFEFNQSDVKYINKYLAVNEDTFKETVNSTIEENLIQKTCIKCQCFGDCDFSIKRALNEALVIINILRFMYCYLYPEYICENRIKINLISDTMIGQENYISINTDDKWVLCQ